MSREVRRVPADWKHPTHPNGNKRPLMQPGKPIADLQREWREQEAAWIAGTHEDQQRYPEYVGTPFTEWAGECPDPADYMPHFPPEERTHWQMYEATSEGTPISPVMETPEALARWLADVRASAFGDMTATYMEWLHMIVGPGWAPSGIYSPGTGLASGVAGFDPK